MLVHGGYHDSSCWRLLLPHIEKPSVAVDLPGRGSRPLTGEAPTLADYAAAVREEADAAGFERFALVGHSMGGLTISRTAADLPGRVACLIYVGALTPPPGVTVAELFGVDIPRGSPDLQPLVAEDHARALFGNDMSDDLWAVARESLVPEPSAAFHFTVDEQPRGIPTTYVQMTDDVPVPPALAAELIPQLGPGVDVRTIEAGHNVMLSQPEVLAAIVNDAAR